MRREKLETANLCKCGCGQKVKLENNFIHGHNGKGVPRSRKTIKKAQQTKRKRNLEKRLIGQPCECGCGEWTSPYCRFISGHNGRNRTKENCISVAIRSAKARGRTKENDPGRAAQAEKMRGRTKETHSGVAAQAAKMMGRTKENDPGVSAMVKKLTGRTKETHPYIARQAEKKKGRTKENDPGRAAQARKISGLNNPIVRLAKTNPVFVKKWRKKIADTVRGRTKETHSYLAENAKNLSKKLKGRTKKTHPYIARRAILTSQKLKGRTKENIKGENNPFVKILKTDPVKLRKWIESQNRKPNKPEIKLDKLLHASFPSEYEYVGDFQFFLGGKNPDFMNVNGQKKLIELFGDYWHKDEDPNIRINHFKQYGFDTLVIWERELKDETSLTEKLVEFHNK